MPEKKTKDTNKSEAAKKDSKTKTPENVEKGNFYVLSCGGETIYSGAKLMVVKVVEKYDMAVDFIKNLQGARPEYLCIVEKKNIFSRMPQIVVKEITTK